MYDGYYGACHCGNSVDKGGFVAMRNAVHLSNSWARTVAASVCLCLVALGAEGAVSDAKRGPDLTELSLEELMDVEVTSVSSA